MKFVPGLYDGISATDYHADIWGSRELPTFSRGMACAILESPLEAWARHPKLGGINNGEVEEDEDAGHDEPEERNENRETGSIYHELLLGGSAACVPVPFKDFRTNAAKAARAEIEAQGGIAVAEPRWLGILHVKDRITESLVAAGVNLADSRKEVTALWYEWQEIEGGQPEYGDPRGHLSGDVHAPMKSQPVVEHHELPCKARIDLLDDDGPRVIITDLKIRRDLKVATFCRNLDRYGLDIQAAVYTLAIEQLLPKMAGRVEFRFALAQKIRPYDVAIVPAGKSILALGEMKWRLAKLKWIERLRAGQWPGVGLCEPAQAEPWQFRSIVAQYIEAFGEGALPDFLQEGE